MELGWLSGWLAMACVKGTPIESWQREERQRQQEVREKTGCGNYNVAIKHGGPGKVGSTVTTCKHT